MALLFDASDEAARDNLDPTLSFHLYNCLDSCLTAEVWEGVEPQLTASPALTPFGIRYFEKEVYDFARTMQAPVSEMMRAGLAIDDYARGKLIESLTGERIRLKRWLMRLIFEGLEVTVETYPFLAEFNINSINPPTANNPKGGHVQRLMYEILALPPVMGDNGKPSVDRDALEKLEKYPCAKPFCMILLALRDIKKNLEDLSFELDPDGKIRTTFGIAATKTGRMASYKATTGTGRNMQNTDPILRHIYCAEKGRKYAYIDLEQAEARIVAAIVWTLFGDAAYLDACESEDLHSAVAMMVWPHIKNRDDAEQLYYRNFSYRFLCKRLSHGSSYFGKPPRLSRETNVPIKQVEEFQERFFARFHGIRRWHHWVSEQLATQGFLVSMMGRKRWFMGRANDDSTLREAIAYDPQGSIADMLNRGLFRLWYHSKVDPENFPIRCLLQVHDAVLVDYPEECDESTLLPRLMDTMITPITLRHGDERRQLIIPAAAEVGYNFGHCDENNPDGLKKWVGKQDERIRRSDPARKWLGL